jgi:excisionase family DNA binding protein
MTQKDTRVQLMTPRQVAEMMQFTTPRPIYKLIREEELPASRIGGRLLIDPDDVQAMLDARRTQQPSRSRGLLDLERQLPSRAKDKAPRHR